VHLQHDPLDLATLIASVSAPDRGALATFVGLVRDHHAGRGVLGLEYSAYGAMAEERCAAIVAEAEGRWRVRIALAHRLGGLAVGEAAVIVVAASAHREAAFEACRWTIEAVKAQVPIWKRERYLDGTEAWVDPTAADGTMPAGGAS
jgi:molybdopterin synthase catalytic subunit